MKGNFLPIKLVLNYSYKMPILERCLLTAMPLEAPRDFLDGTFLSLLSSYEYGATR